MIFGIFYGLYIIKKQAHRKHRQKLNDSAKVIQNGYNSKQYGHISAKTCYIVYGLCQGQSTVRYITKHALKVSN